MLSASGRRPPLDTRPPRRLPLHTVRAATCRRCRPSPSAPSICTWVDGVRGSWFELYFTDPANPAARQASGGVDDRLVEAIDAARLSIHVAVYNLSLNNVRQALIGAHRRGVEVRLVTESDNLDGEDLQRLMEAGVPVLGDRREGTMHDKFMVIDGVEVWTGSMNYTVSGAYADNNCLMRIFSDVWPRATKQEFAEMFAEDTIRRARSATPTPCLRWRSMERRLRCYFSPDDGAESVIVNLLDTAQESVDFLAFSFTSNPLGDAVRPRRSRPDCARPWCPG